MTRHDVKAVVLSDNMKWLVVTILSLLSMFGSGYTAYSNNDTKLKTDLTHVQEKVEAVERHRAEDKVDAGTRLERIENKLDRLIERSR